MRKKPVRICCLKENQATFAVVVREFGIKDIVKSTGLMIITALIAGRKMPFVLFGV